MRHCGLFGKMSNLIHDADIDCPLSSSLLLLLLPLLGAVKGQEITNLREMFWCEIKNKK